MDDWLNVIKAKEAKEYRELFAQLEAGMCPHTNKWLYSSEYRSSRDIQHQIHLIIEQDKQTNDCIVTTTEITNPFRYWTKRYKK
jgi:hypothetical protein